jgi:hypothetical protein
MWLTRKNEPRIKPGQDLPESLQRALSSINLIENLLSRVREVARRVKRWQGGTMILRWTAAGALEAERSFRKLAADAALPCDSPGTGARNYRADLLQIRRLESGQLA